MRLLQCRQKWRQAKPNYKVGYLVLVEGEVNPHRAWPLGDGLVRTVKVKNRMDIFLGTKTRLVDLKVK